jgi:hypothetical protein
MFAESLGYRLSFRRIALCRSTSSPPGANKPMRSVIKRSQSRSLSHERSQRFADPAFERGDRPLVALVECPLFDALGVHQARAHEHPHMLAQRGLADAELFGDQETTHSVLHEIAVHLWPEMLDRILEPVEYPEATVVAQGVKLFEQSLICHGRHDRPFSDRWSLAHGRGPTEPREERAGAKSDCGSAIDAEKELVYCDLAK